jgi:hypothetical protein
MKVFARNDSTLRLTPTTPPKSADPNSFPTTTFWILSITW